MLRFLSILMIVVVSYGIITEHLVIMTSFKYITYLIGGISILGYLLTVVLKNKDTHLRRHLLTAATYKEKYPLLNKIFTVINILFICILFGYEKVLFGSIWTWVYIFLPILIKAIAEDVYEQSKRKK